MKLKFRIWDGEKYLNEPRLGLSLLNCESKICDTACFGKTLQLFTGLLDKKGKEIYEGDILRYDYGFDGIPYHYHEVKFGESRDCRWGFYINKCLCASTKKEFEEGEVIGNIFENSDLLK